MKKIIELTIATKEALEYQGKQNKPPLKLKPYIEYRLEELAKTKPKP